MAASIKIVRGSDDEDETPPIGQAKAVCSICVKNTACYTCPRCNVQYCSLACYRDKKHEGCSEAFYRDWVLEDLKERAVNPEDRQKVLEMLAREHEEQQDMDSDDDDTPDLRQRLEGLDLDKDVADVWQRLTVQEREEFAHMLKDGRLSHLVTIWTPWWMSQPSSGIQEASGDGLPKGYPPHLTDIPDINQLLKGKPSAEIKYNMVNVISAYTFVTRLHNGDHLECPAQCAQDLLKICGVLHSSVTYQGSREAVHAVISEIQKEGSGFVVPTSFPIVLVGDVVRVLQGHKLFPLCAVSSALSDSSALLKAASRELKQASSGNKGRKQSKTMPHSDDPDLSRQLFLAKKKVLFLASWTQRFGMCLAPLCAELGLELDCLKSEAAETQSLQAVVERQLQAGKLQPQAPGAKVTELP